MPRFMLIMRGSAEAWSGLDDDTQRTLLQRYHDFVDGLTARGGYGGGAPFAPRMLELSRYGKELRKREQEASGRMATGFFIFEAADWAEAESTAAGCPALEHGETVELLRLADVDEP